MTAAREDTSAGADGGIGETLRGATFAWLGRAYLHDNQPWLARTAFRLAVHAQPLSAEFRCLFGETLEALAVQGLRYREEARETLLVAAEIDPTHRRAWHGANRSTAAPDNVPEERRAAGAALTNYAPQADTAEAYALRGLEHAAQGDAPAALAAYIAAADRWLTAPMILWRLGCALAANGDGPAAVAPLAAAARLDPTRARLRRTRRRPRAGAAGTNGDPPSWCSRFHPPEGITDSRTRSTSRRGRTRSRRTGP